jgi:hypothetical protein
MGDSDWRNYWSSSEELKKELAVHGKDNFKRTILHLCSSKTEMNYRELYEQIVQEVLLRPEFYNSFVGTKIHKKHIKFSHT